MDTFNSQHSSSLLNYNEDSIESNPFANASSQSPEIETSSTIETHLPNDLQEDDSVKEETNQNELTNELGELSLNTQPNVITKDNREEDTQSASLQVPKSGSRPYFKVTIEDPQKVGDAIKAYIIYKVRTKTNSPAFRSSEFVVARRFSDFLWLYNQLTLGNPGVIVPPVPEKHAFLGRFQNDFVESRRIALERCLQKIVAHPMLYGDPDLKVFLESESFNVEKRQRRAEPENSKMSFMRSFGETITHAATNPFSKFVEVDEWFESKKNQLDALEVQLKGLLKSVEGVIKQRKELGAATLDFGESMFPLASAELNRNLSTHLMVLGEIQKKMKDLHEQQAQYDIITLENTIDEYIRIIGSIRIAFNARIKAFQTYQQADSEYQKKLSLFEKLKQQKADKQHELNEMKARVEELRDEFDDISKLIKNELDRFDKEKVEDFRDSVEQFLKSMIEHQKQIIALWETYFEQTEGLSDNDGEEVTASTI
ncbi:Vps5 C terminal like-domain-containing protein [Cokeromyces recurvatus]|uniref:Vps5 C terminal like-domain-containing protein n=1 Tax=Cokeromyces recurvatus TaxID=90255 RepID=UPI00221F35B0|nr:Vps5 C terminal like-domain-containing protein [Cokeromyces recurvatus]KAI7906554.1 Vps5 C terminal like-domain-containing protein [Cokeromyces recurvatus]